MNALPVFPNTELPGETFRLQRNRPDARSVWMIRRGQHLGTWTRPEWASFARQDELGPRAWTPTGSSTT